MGERWMLVVVVLKGAGVSEYCDKTPDVPADAWPEHHAHALPVQQGAAGDSGRSTTKAFSLKDLSFSPLSFSFVK